MVDKKKNIKPIVAAVIMACVGVAAFTTFVSLSSKPVQKASSVAVKAEQGQEDALLEADNLLTQPVQSEEEVIKAPEAQPSAALDFDLLQKPALNPDFHYAGVQEEGGVVQVKFAPQQSYLPDGARDILGKVVQEGKRGKKIALMTYTLEDDASKTAKKLSSERTKKIKELLVNVGVSEQGIIISESAVVATDIVDVDILLDRVDVEIKDN